MASKQTNAKAPKEAVGKGYKFDAKASTHKTSASPRKAMKK